MHGSTFHQHSRPHPVNLIPNPGITRNEMPGYFKSGIGNTCQLLIHSQRMRKNIILTCSKQLKTHSFYHRFTMIPRIQQAVPQITESPAEDSELRLVTSSMPGLTRLVLTWAAGSGASRLHRDPRVERDTKKIRSTL